MTPPAKVIGHPVSFAKGLVGLFRQGCWEIPEIMGSSFMALLGMGMAAIGLARYCNNNGDNSEFKSVYYIVRKGDPRACNLKNPAISQYPGVKK